MSKIILPKYGSGIEPASLSRRRFVKGLAAGSALMGLGFSVDAKPSAEAMKKILAGPTILRGSKFDLTYSPLKVNFTGNERIATAINGSVPAPVLRWKEGDTVTLNVTN
ncbi:MAG: multicopper oxidase domain-containing protein, partial [Gammaproteobacteria bacterium]|nr:multicopper oxidase domain-containing protein [Gammaproteobacteria bacterium]